MSASSLSDFIRANSERILAEWEAFARTCAPAAEIMDVAALRDHAAAMLTWIADDLETKQSARQMDLKARGLGPVMDGETIASMHGQERFQDQFTLPQICAEFRALRASVIRLWTNGRTIADAEELRDLGRFNEAIDQLVAESVLRFSNSLEEARDMFAAILSHDLRTPLGAMIVGAKYLQATLPQRTEVLETASRILNSGNRMARLITDILDFSRVRLGGTFPVYPAEIDMEEVCRQIIEEAAAGQPDREIDLQCEGSLPGCWDRERVGQVIANLVANALQHGDRSAPVSVALRGGADDVMLAVHNWGPTISRQELAALFDPARRLANGGQSGRYNGSLGLGLHIARLIVAAHGGAIEVESTQEKGTTFTVRLPKNYSSPSPITGEVVCQGSNP